MTDTHTTALATAIVLATGILWGVYWLPVRALASMGLTGPSGTLAITLSAALLLAPAAIPGWRPLVRTDGVALVSIALGGAAFALYSIGFVYGRVAIIILLYFLTPVWSTLIGRYLMGWPTPRGRILAICLGLAGLGVMLGADGAVPLPDGAGEWMALAAGLLWSIATTGIRARSKLGPVEATFVFAAGAALTALLLTLLLVLVPGLFAEPVLGTAQEAGPPAQDDAAAGQILRMGLLALAAGGLWWGLSTAALMWATMRLEPARVGILLMTEVLVGAASAALLAGEVLTPLEITGGAMVLGASLLEIWSPQRPARAPGNDRPD